MMLADLAALAMVSLSAYVQWSISTFAVGTAQIWWTRIVLAGLGTALGLFAVYLALLHDAPAPTTFCIAFGQVHVPAAFALLLRARRHAWLSRR